MNIIFLSHELRPVTNRISNFNLNFINKLYVGMNDECVLDVSATKEWEYYNVISKHRDRNHYIL